MQLARGRPRTPPAPLGGGFPPKRPPPKGKKDWLERNREKLGILFTYKVLVPVAWQDQVVKYMHLEAATEPSSANVRVTKHVARPLTRLRQYSV